MKLIQVGAAKAAFGWPLFATWNAWVFSSTHHAGAAKVSTFLTFVPFLAITTLFWAAIWTAVIWLVSRLG